MNKTIGAISIPLATAMVVALLAIAVPVAYADDTVASDSGLVAQGIDEYSDSGYPDTDYDDYGYDDGDSESEFDEEDYDEPMDISELDMLVYSKRAYDSKRECYTYTIPAQRYTGSAIRPKLTVAYYYWWDDVLGDADERTSLVEGVDYRISFSNNTQIGTAKVTITGIGDFTGSVSKSFKICNMIGDAEVKAPKHQTYTGKRIKPKVKVTHNGITLKRGVDYTLSYKSNKNVGTAKAIVKGKGKFAGKKTVSFKIRRAPIAKARIGKLGEEQFKGGSVKPVPKVKYKGVRLRKGEDFKLTYKANKGIGKAKVTIAGIGNFKGKCTKTFRIGLGNGAVEDVYSPVYDGFKVAAKKVPGAQKYQFVVCEKQSGKKVVKKMTAKKRAVKVVGLEQAKKYYVKVRPVAVKSGKKYYGDWSRLKPGKTGTHVFVGEWELAGYRNEEEAYHFTNYERGMLKAFGYDYSLVIRKNLTGTIHSEDGSRDFKWEIVNAKEGKSGELWMSYSGGFLTLKVGDTYLIYD